MGRQHSDGQHPEETDKRRRILIRMCAVGIEETATVGPQILDEFQRRHRTFGDGLNSSL